MEIFKDTAQAVRFAFILDDYPMPMVRDRVRGVSSVVRHVLAEAGAQASPEQLVAHPLPQLWEHGRRIMLAVRGNLLRIESNALTAALSRNWEEKRAAVHALAPHFRSPLSRIVKDWKLVEKLVLRHYIPHKDRGPGWDLESLSNEFSTPKSRISRAAQVVDRHARQLEAEALKSLQEIIDPQESRKPDLRASIREVAHA